MCDVISITTLLYVKIVFVTVNIIFQGIIIFRLNKEKPRVLILRTTDLQPLVIKMSMMHKK